MAANEWDGYIYLICLLLDPFIHETRSIEWVSEWVSVTSPHPAWASLLSFYDEHDVASHLNWRCSQKDDPAGLTSNLHRYIHTYIHTYHRARTLLPVIAVLFTKEQLSIVAQLWKKHTCAVVEWPRIKSNSITLVPRYYTHSSASSGALFSDIDFFQRVRGGKACMRPSLTVLSRLGSKLSTYIEINSIPGECLRPKRTIPRHPWWCVRINQILRDRHGAVLQGDWFLG